MLLARYYVEEFNKKFKKKVKGFAEDAERILMAYPWPGNVRELKNIVERIMILHSDGAMITAESLRRRCAQRRTRKNYESRSIISCPNCPPKGSIFTQVTERIANDIKKKIIENTLEMSRGNKTEAARRLGISRYKLIREQKKINNKNN